MKKLLSVFLTCIMLACMLPTFAFAEAEYNLWVGGVKVTDEKATDITGDGTVSYDADNNMLTLNGATITRTGNGSGIYYSGTNPLTIKLIGTNSVTGSTYGICSAATLNITGTGSLVANGNTQAISPAPTTDAAITASTDTTPTDLVAFDPANMNINNYKYLKITNDTAVRGTFSLTKAVNGAAGFVDGGNTVSNFGDLVSIAAPSFKIEAYKSFNRQVGRSDIPAFIPESYQIPVSNGEGSIEIITPNYAAAGVGDYWYKVTETLEGAAGLTIDGTNPRYLHVQVEWKKLTENPDTYDVGGEMVATVTLHNTAPETTGTYTNTADDKTTGFTNTYGAGELVISKKVTGNMGDPNKMFAVTVKFTAPDGKTVKSPISYTGGFADENGNTAYTDEQPGTIATGWTDPQTVTLYLKHDSTVTFSNIPDGVTYEIKEADYSGDGYTTEYAITNGEDGETNKDVVVLDTENNNKHIKVTGKISDSLDTVTITNNKQVAIDVGVTLDNAPFVLLLIGSIAFLALCFVLKRRKEEAC